MLRECYDRAVKTFCSVIVVLVAATAQARDSTWLLCSDESLVVSSHEHRASGGDGRATSLTLIFGVHEMHGMLKDADSAKVTLKAATESGTAFSGKISVDYQANELQLIGILKIDGEPNDIDATLQCKEMSVEL